MARLTETGALAGARANPPRSRASFPGTVGPEEGNEPARPIPAVKRKNAAQEMSFRTGVFTRLSISVCYARGMSQKIGETYSTNFSQCTGAQRCKPPSCKPDRREPQARGDINFSAAEARQLFPRRGSPRIFSRCPWPEVFSAGSDSGAPRRVPPSPAWPSLKRHPS